MAKLSKEEMARREGMAYALRIAKEKGIDALEEDLKMRNAINLPLRVSKADLDKFSDNVKYNTMRNAINLPLRVSKADLDKFSDNVKYNTILYIKILMAVTMHDEFGFGNKRIKQMFKRFDLKAECIAENYSNWEDQVKIIAEECGIDMETERRDLRTVIK
ncbi:hypothetical protein DXA21_21125 [Parabacteroides distasonis]|nr:hypothetical protein DXA21_21125 [Parabacteroides distasonis]